MTGLRRYLRRLLTTFRPSRAETELAREINAHLQLLEDQFVAGGMSREEAGYAARRAFGGVEQVKELQREARGLRWLAGWPMDLKLGARMLVKSPGLTVVAVIALAVAIGAGAAYLEFTHDLMRPSLPGERSDRIVGVQIWDPQRHEPEMLAIGDFARWRDLDDTFDLLGAARRVDSYVTTSDGRLARVRGVEISASAFRLLPVSPLLGRALADGDERLTAAPVAVIGSDLWSELFDADPSVVGRTLRVGSVVHTVVGVMPPEFGFPTNKNLWTALKVQAAGVKRGEGPYINMFGRLKHGVSAAVAQARLQGTLTAGDSSSNTAGALRADVRPYIESLLFEDLEGNEFKILHAANVLFLMLLAICGANVATLVFARTATREGEIAVRSALGASRGRISAQLFAEALVLSSVAAVTGLLVAQFIGLWGKQMFVQYADQPRPFWWDDRLSPETILYAFALAVLAALIVGLVPALKSTGRQLQGRLREAGSAGSTASFGWVWTGVMVTQVAITVIFLTSVAAFAWTTLRTRLDYDVTFPRAEYATARLARMDAGSGGSASIAQHDYRAIVDRIRRLPGVASVTYGSELPGHFEPAWCRLEFDAPEVMNPEIDQSGARCQRVGPEYFQTLGARLVTGRLFTDIESDLNQPVAIVDETFVREMLGGRNALGLMVREPRRVDNDTPGPWREIIGVVKDLSVRTRKSSTDAMVYLPATIAAAEPAQLLIHTHGVAAPIVPALRTMFSADAELRLVEVGALDHVADAGGHALHFLLRVVTVVSAVALLLSTAGIYALISFTLTRRTKEIGIRVALGASRRRLITGVLARALLQIGGGLIAGAVPGAMIMIYGIGGMRLVSGVGATLMVCAFIGVVALVSCATPLGRALRIDPARALRAD